MGKTLPKEAFKRRHFERQDRKKVEIYDVLQELKKIRMHLCPNRVIKIEYYKHWVSDHLQKAADIALHPKVMALHKYY